jgi:hypothetical protein
MIKSHVLCPLILSSKRFGRLTGANHLLSKNIYWRARAASRR